MEEIYYQKDNVKFNLTKMFGKGNEPTLEQFESMFPKPYYSYVEGTRVNIIKRILLKILATLKNKKFRN